MRCPCDLATAHAPQECLAKYVRYVREKVRPVLSADAIKVLQDFYLQMRKDFTTEDATPVREQLYSRPRRPGVAS